MIIYIYIFGTPIRTWLWSSGLHLLSVCSIPPIRVMHTAVQVTTLRRQKKEPVHPLPWGMRRSSCRTYTTSVVPYFEVYEQCSFPTSQVRTATGPMEGVVGVSLRDRSLPSVSSTPPGASYRTPTIARSIVATRRTPMGLACASRRYRHYT